MKPPVQPASICFKSSRLWASSSRTRFCSARASTKSRPRIPRGRRHPAVHGHPAFQVSFAPIQIRLFRSLHEFMPTPCPTPASCPAAHEPAPGLPGSVTTVDGLWHLGFQHPFVAAIISAFVLPALHQLFRFKHLRVREEKF